MLHHYAVYSGKAVCIDYATDPKAEFSLACYRVRDNANSGHVVDTRGQVYWLSSRSKRVLPVFGKEAEVVKSLLPESA